MIERRTLWHRRSLMVMVASPMGFWPFSGLSLSFLPVVLWTMGTLGVIVTSSGWGRRSPLMMIAWVYLASMVPAMVLLGSSPVRVFTEAHLGLGVLGAMAIAQGPMGMRQLARWMVTIGGAMVGIALLVGAFGFSPSARLWAPTPNPGMLATYLVGAVPVALLLMRTEWRWSFYLIAFAGAILLTGTRAAVIGVVAMAPLLLGLSPWALSRRAQIALAVAVVGVVLLALGWRSPDLTLLTGDLERLGWWRDALAMSTERVFGWGLWGFADAGLVDAGGLAVDAPHNVYLQEILARGVLAPLTFLLLGATARVLWRVGTPLSRALLASMVGLGVMGIWWIPSLYMGLWLILAMGYAMRMDAREVSE